MRPIGQLQTVKPSTPVSDVLMVMSKEDINQMPVMTNGHLEGVISRAHILQVVQARAEIQPL
jgi:CBS domain-containing protein